MLERLQAGVVADIGHHQDLRVRRVGPPGRVALQRSSVLVGDAAPGLEPHDAVGIEPQNRRAVDAEAMFERVQGGVVDGRQPLGSRDRRHQRAERAYAVNLIRKHVVWSGDPRSRLGTELTY